VVWVDAGDGGASEAQVRVSKESVAAQVGVTAEISVGQVPEESALGNSCWVVRVEPGVRLAPWALFWFAMAVRHQPDRQVWYGDHDRLSETGKRVDPTFKPAWSPELALVSAYVGQVFAVHSSVLQTIALAGKARGAYEWMLTVARHSDNRVGHVPVVLSHEPANVPPLQPTVEMLQHYLEDAGVAADAELDARGHPRVRYRPPEPAPCVSIIIPTRDMLHFLETCVNSVLEKTRWPTFEVLVVDNQSSCKDTLAYMQRMSRDTRVRVLHYDQPFNFSAINNFAVQQAKGDVICLLNNDTEVITPEWLEEMVTRLHQPGVGAVGARLLFSSGQVQHAGDVLGPGGCATHLHGVIDGENPGYMNRAVLPQELSAVTGACLVTHTALYRQLGGLDEARLPVAFNDVDYCLRVREAGYRVVYTPYAELYHHESVSRGKDNNPQKVLRAKRETAYMRQRWAHVIEQDPFYNLNLNYTQPDFRLGRLPRVNLNMNLTTLFAQA
jgi:GT2 family glycosyltransferase